MIMPALNLAGAMVTGRGLCYVCVVDGGISSETSDCIELLGPWTCRRHLDV